MTLAQLSVETPIKRGEMIPNIILKMLICSCFLYSVLYIAQTTAQTCSDAGGGPCLNDVCTPGFTCLLDQQLCCADGNVIDVTTTASSDASLDSSDTTVSSGGTASSTATVSTVASTTTAATSATCVDKLNPSTGRSDCPARVSLCNDTTYYAVMTEQCPRTCGRCSSSSSSTCVDKTNPATGISDCPALSHLCNNTPYLTLMAEQCPRTCNKCSSTGASDGTTVSSTTCADKVNPRTGTSDCSMRVSLCHDANYVMLMRTECPRTCGYCSASSVNGATAASTVNSATAATTTTGTCADSINPRTGTSDCPQRVSLCNDAVYRSLMVSQCPRTCGFC